MHIIREFYFFCFKQACQNYFLNSSFIDKCSHHNCHPIKVYYSVIFLVHSQNSANINTLQFQNIFTRLSELQKHAFHLSLQLQKTTNLLSVPLHMSVLHIHTKETTQYVASCIWFLLCDKMLSRFIHIATCINTSSPCPAKVFRCMTGEPSFIPSLLHV